MGLYTTEDNKKSLIPAVNKTNDSFKFCKTRNRSSAGRFNSSYSFSVMFIELLMTLNHSRLICVCDMCVFIRTAVIINNRCVKL